MKQTNALHRDTDIYLAHLVFMRQTHIHIYAYAHIDDYPNIYIYIYI